MPGQIGNKGGGRTGHGLDKKVATLKGYLLDAIYTDITEEKDEQGNIIKLKQDRALYWAEKLKDRLMPNEIKGTGDNGELVIQVINYANNTNTPPVQTEAIPNTIPPSNGQGV